MNLVRLRRKRNLTQADLAQMVGVSRSLIARVEAGWEKPYRKLRREIAKVLEVEEEKIFK